MEKIPFKATINLADLLIAQANWKASRPKQEKVLKKIKKGKKK